MAYNCYFICYSHFKITKNNSAEPINLVFGEKLNSISNNCTYGLYVCICIPTWNSFD